MTENGRSPGANRADGYRLTSVNHALDVLEVLGASGEPLALGDVAKATSLVKSGAYRILYNLEMRGYVSKDAASRYRLSLGVWSLAHALTRVEALREQARPLLVAITAATGETTHLAMLDRLYVVYIDKAETPSSIRAYAEIGDRAPAHAVATGKALLAALRTEEFDQVVSGSLDDYTISTISNAADLRSELERIRSHGFALNDGEWRQDVVGVAVPVQIRPGLTVALGVAGPRYRFPPERARSYVALLRDKGAELRTYFER